MYSFQRSHLVIQQICSPFYFFVRACTAAFSAHSNLLYVDNKYANGTTICTSLPRHLTMLQTLLVQKAKKLLNWKASPTRPTDYKGIFVF